MNVDIFACINFREFAKMDNFVCIKIRVLSATGSIGYYKSNFRGVHIFRAYLRNANCGKICTARKYLHSQYIIFYQIIVLKVSRTNLNAYNCYLMWNIGCKYSDSPPIIQYDKRTAPSGDRSRYPFPD